MNCLVSLLLLLFSMILCPRAAVAQDSDAEDEFKPDATYTFGDQSKIPPNPNKPPAGSQSLKVPKLTDEEKFLKRLPDDLLCDACQAITYQLSLALSKAEDKLISSRRGKPLRESEYLEVMENVCIQKWDEYGVKDVDGVHRLSGPGLEAEKHFSMMYGGGDWPGRLERKCREILGEVGEDEIYELYRSDNGLKTLCTEHATDCKKKPKKKTTKKKSKKEEL